MQIRLNVEKRNAAKIAEESTPSTRDGRGENDEDEESESRTSTFEKKRLASPTSLLQALKKQKLLVMLSRLNLWIRVIIELESDTCV